MGAHDMAAGYPVHAVSTYSRTVTEHDIRLIDWVAACGATGQTVGKRQLGNADSARWRELCPACWPNRHATYHPKAVEITGTETG